MAPARNKARVRRQPVPGPGCAARGNQPWSRDCPFWSGKVSSRCMCSHRARLASAPTTVKFRPCLVMLRSEEHTSELQSLMRISYAVFCLTKKHTDKQIHTYHQKTQPVHNYQLN